MESEKKYYIDSYGRTHHFYDDINILSNMRRRSAKDVKPEVIELLQRIYKRSTDIYSFAIAEYISLELNVRLGTILRVFKELQRDGAVLQNPKDVNKSKALKMSQWVRNVYKITSEINNLE